MTTQNTNTTPELINEVTIEGEVFSHDLEVKNQEVIVKNNGASEKVKMDVIQGVVEIRTAENEIHKVRLYSRAKTNAGDDNKQYAGYVTLMNELVTVKQIAEGKAPEGSTPTKVRATQAKLDVSEFYNDAGQLKAYPQSQGRFINRLKETDTYTPRAEYDVEGIVGSVRAEIKNEEETGRMIIQLLVPTFNGAVELEFVAPAEYQDYIQTSFEPNMTVNLYGNILNFSEKTVIKEAGGFGEDKSKEKWTNVHELQVRGGKVYEYDEDSMVNKAYSPSQVNELKAKRAEQLAKAKAKAEEKKAGGSKPNGFSGAPKTPQNGGSKPPVGNFF